MLVLDESGGRKGYYQSLIAVQAAWNLCIDVDSDSITATTPKNPRTLSAEA